MSAARQTWKLLDPDALAWREWEDECVVFNSASGDTHLFDAVSACAVRLLAAQPASAAILAERLASQVGVQYDAELVTRMERLLQKLDALGLIEPADG